jgi:hypothetical protein
MELALRALSNLSIGVFGGGGTAVLRRPSTIPSVVLHLTAAVLSGSQTLTAQAAGLDAGARVVEGCQFTVAGVAGTYTVAADAEVQEGESSISLSFTPGLAGLASTHASLTITQEYAEHAFSRMRGTTVAESEDLVVKGQEVAFGGGVVSSYRVTTEAAG